MNNENTEFDLINTLRTAVIMAEASYSLPLDKTSANALNKKGWLHIRHKIYAHREKRERSWNWRVGKIIS